MATCTSTTIAVTYLLIISSFILVSTLSINTLSFECTPETGCFYPNPTPARKILMGVSINDGVEMRNVPSGPDPLHHNGVGGPQIRNKH